MCLRDFARQSPIVGPLAHRSVDFRGQHDLVAWGKVSQRPAQDLFAEPVGVNVGRIEKVDA